jgi:response regulator RpfG family c-di-GMP phosphodiesterase
MVLDSPTSEAARSEPLLPTVLVVDDDPEALSSLRRSLRSEAFHLLTTQSPFQALEWVRSAPIGLVITDEFMPGMLGTELLEAIRRCSPDTATVLLTGYPKPSVLFRGFQQRVDLFLAKPWGDQALRDAAVRLLHERAPRGIDSKGVRP